MAKDPVDALPATLAVIFDTVCIIHESEDMSKSLKKDDSSSPSMKKVERVVGNTQDPYERVVPKREENRRDHVKDGQCSTSSAKFGEALLLKLLRDGEAVGDVACGVDDDDD